jgi:hypothetical protein
MSSMIRMKSAHDEKISFCPASEGSAQLDISGAQSLQLGEGGSYRLDRRLQPGDLSALLVTRIHHVADGLVRRRFNVAPTRLDAISAQRCSYHSRKGESKAMSRRNR